MTSTSDDMNDDSLPEPKKASTIARRIRNGARWVSDTTGGIAEPRSGRQVVQDLAVAGTLLAVTAGSVVGLDRFRASQINDESRANARIPVDDNHLSPEIRKVVRSNEKASKIPNNYETILAVYQQDLSPRLKKLFAALKKKTNTTTVEEMAKILGLDPKKIGNNPDAPLFPIVEARVHPDCIKWSEEASLEEVNRNNNVRFAGNDMPITGNDLINYVTRVPGHTSDLLTAMDYDLSGGISRYGYPVGIGAVAVNTEGEFTAALAVHCLDGMGPSLLRKVTPEQEKEQAEKRIERGERAYPRVTDAGRG